MTRRIKAVIAVTVLVVLMAIGFVSFQANRMAPQSAVPPPAPASPPVRAPASASPLDDALSKLLRGNIAFTSPENARVGETVEVEALLSTTLQADELMRQLTVAGKQESDALAVSDRMQASLVGGGAFDVTPAGPQPQWISRDKPTRWHWLVTPRLTGPQILTLTVDAILTIKGEEGTRTITTLTRQIDVDVARPHNADEWFGAIRQWIDDIGWGWGVLVGVVGALLGLWRGIRNWWRPSPPNDDS